MGYSKALQIEYLRDFQVQRLEGFRMEEVIYCETKLVDSSVLVSLLKLLVLLLECTTALDEIDQFRFRVA